MDKDCFYLHPLANICFFYFPLTPAEKHDQYTPVLLFFSVGNLRKTKHYVKTSKVTFKIKTVCFKYDDKGKDFDTYMKKNFS